MDITAENHRSRRVAPKFYPFLAELGVFGDVRWEIIKGLTWIRGVNVIPSGSSLTQALTVQSNSDAVQGKMPEVVTAGKSSDLMLTRQNGVNACGLDLVSIKYLKREIVSL